MDDGIGPDGRMDGELAARLSAFAAALGPSPAAVGRMRRGILGSAAFAAVAADTAPGARWSLRLPPLFRRPLVAFATAALLVVLAVGGAFAASPGGPLYGARLWLENATLPAEADARTDAEIARLDDRLAEAESAAGNGNGDAVTAALDAYASIVEGAFAATGGDLTREGRLQLVLQRHRAVLEALVASHADRGASAAAIQAALDRNAETIDRILSATPAGPDHTSGTGGSGQPANGGNGQRPSPGGTGAGAGGGGGAGGNQGQGQGQGQGQSQGPGAGHTPPAAAGGNPNRPASPTPSHRPNGPDASKSPRP